MIHGDIWALPFVVGLLLLLSGSSGCFSVVLVFVLALDFHGRLRVLGTMFIRGVLHGVEASFLAVSSLRKLRVVNLWPMLGQCSACLMV